MIDAETEIPEALLQLGKHAELLDGQLFKEVNDAVGSIVTANEVILRSRRATNYQDLTDELTTLSTKTCVDAIKTAQQALDALPT